jgi:hypothetical protein
MVRGSGKTKHILSPSEREAILSEKQELETTLKERESYGAGTSAEQLDKAKINQEINRLDRVIDEGTAPKLRGNQKDELAKRSEALKLVIADGMPTREEMNHPERCPGAVRKHMAWLNRNADNIRQFQQIQLSLNPDNPESVEALRKEK